MQKRSKYFAYPQVQTLIVIGYLSTLLGFFAITLFIMSLSYTDLMQLGKEAHLPDDHVYFSLIGDQVETIMSQLVTAVIVAALIGSAFLIWVSLRLVGPIVATVGYLERYRRDKDQGLSVAPFQLRERDYFHDLAEAVNLALNEKPVSSTKETV
jgi:hypothetical protein